MKKPTKGSLHRSRKLGGRNSTKRKTIRQVSKPLRVLETSVTSSEAMLIQANTILKKLVEDAAPLVAVAAYGGGSLFYKTWVDEAGRLGIEIVNPYIDPAQEGEGTYGELE